VLRASEAAHRGVPVGLHTYYSVDPRLQRLLALPNVSVAKTHRRVLVLMRRRARARGLDPAGPDGRPASAYEEVSHVREDPE
jgi:hypothetical protein